MKSFIIFTLFLSFSLWHCNGETESLRAPHKFGARGYCTYKEKSYKAGEHQIPGECTRVICSPKGWISVHNCIENVQTNRRSECIEGQKVDVTEPFPECCKKEYVCPRTDGTVETIRDY